MVIWMHVLWHKILISHVTKTNLNALLWKQMLQQWAASNVAAASTSCRCNCWSWQLQLTNQLWVGAHLDPNKGSTEVQEIKAVLRPKKIRTRTASWLAGITRQSNTNLKQNSTIRLLSTDLNRRGTTTKRAGKSVLQLFLLVPRSFFFTEQVTYFWEGPLLP